MTHAEESLWPKFLIIEDARSLWSKDLFSALAQYSYATTARTKLKVMMRRQAR
jgi:hypothetical protein